MGQSGQLYPSVKPYLGTAIATTLAVTIVPVVIVFALLSYIDPDPPMLLTAAIGVIVSIAITTLGASLWSRRRDSVVISFSELMVWRWWQRRRAEKRLEDGAKLLGLDRSGQPVAAITLPPEQQLQVLRDLTGALESKDPYTLGHSRRVERHCYRTAAAMGLTVQQLEDLRKAASLHDVGKIRVPDKVLRKPTGLTIEERAMMEEHAVVGAWMVSSVGTADVIEGVRHHHERFDGFGYPDGLSGDEIPLFARVIAVADAYDAITSTRPYRAGSGRDHAVEVLRADAGSQFDPGIVEAFIAALPTRIPVAAGLLVALAGPDTILRRAAAWFKRLGPGSVAPAVAATGTAVVLGASVFTPNLPARVVEKPVAASAQETSDASSTPPTSSVKGRLGKHTHKGKVKAVKVRTLAAPAKDVETDVVLAEVIANEASPDQIEAAEGSAQDDPAHEPKDDPAHEPGPTSQDEAGTSGDPNPDKGRDCGEEHPGNPEGPGHLKHCG